MRLRITSLIFGIAIAATVSSAYGQETTLRYRWVNGDDIRYRMTLQTGVTMSGLPGLGVMTTDMNMVEVVRLVVDDVRADGGATLRQTLESMRLEMHSPLQNAVVDSAVTDGPPDRLAVVLRPMISALQREPIILTVLPAGGVTSVAGMSRIFETLAASLPAGVAATPEFNQLRTSMSDEAMRGVYDQNLMAFPDHPLKAGDSWTSEFRANIPAIGSQTVSRTATFKGVEVGGGASTARIALATTMSGNEGDPLPGPMGARIKFSGSTSQGEILFDLTKGRVQQTALTSEIPMTVTMTGPDGANITVQSVVRGTIKMEIVKD